MEQPSTEDAGLSPAVAGLAGAAGAGPAAVRVPAPALSSGEAPSPAGPESSAGAEPPAGPECSSDAWLCAGPAPWTSGPPSPVRRLSVRGQVLDALRAALLEGELVPGEVYSAPALGESFGVSATPVREAMQQLVLEGAVEVVPNRGYRVSDHSARELAELAEVRALVEVPVILRLARTVPAARWAELRPFAEATSLAASCGDRAGYAVSDRAFHRAVLALSGNRELVRTAEELHRRAQWPPVAGPPARRRADLLADAAEHTALLDALTAGDLAAAESLVREHFTGVAA